MQEKKKVVRKKHAAARYADSRGKQGAAGANKKKRKLSKGAKAGIIAASVVVVILLAAVLGVAYLLNRVDYQPLDSFSLVDSIVEEPEEVPSDVPIVTDPDAMQFGTGDIMSSPDVENILLIGSDTRGEVYGRADTMIILSINRAEGTLKMSSLMRDMYVKIPGQEDNRINAAYAWGGPPLLIETIEQNFRVQIDRYVRVDFAAFTHMIDMLGGVTVTITADEAAIINQECGTAYTAGSQHLTGAAALSYSRIRKLDSDFGRTQRQRNVIEALIQQFKNSSPTTMIGFPNAMLPEVQTDMDSGKLLSLATESPTIMNYTLSQFRLPMDGESESVSIRGMSVLVPDIEANREGLQQFIYG